MEEQEALASTYNRSENPLLIVLSGPSGVGKDVTLKRLQERAPKRFHFVVTATTRPIREGEVNGKDYFFVTKGEFAEMMEKGELLEHAVVYGDYKGIPKQQVRDALASGKDVIMRIDVQGAATIRRLVDDAIFIFLTATTEEELVERLRQRKTEDEGQLAIRIATAREEIKRVNEFDYVVTNADDLLETTVDRILAIVSAEKCRVEQREVTL
ncbi:MAG: guanylate kinase [Anaerolineales bacterium]|nr:guanylate kinase [Anaerolineales bacterium]MCB9126302.1 guanylate kinase [Ardenticatenales bacterium]MCB9171313.1 guanylate kinase [Ardenticatenales bacterium]